MKSYRHCKAMMFCTSPALTDSANKIKRVKLRKLLSNPMGPLDPFIQRNFVANFRNHTMNYGWYKLGLSAQYLLG